MKSADAVIVHLHSGVIPSLENRNPRQKWIFLNDESPYGVFSMAYYKNITPVGFSDLHNVFNWSMMYRTDADVPVPYGRTVALKQAKYTSLDPPIAKLVPYWKRKRGLIAILMSNCGVNYRLELVKDLGKYIFIDFFGDCGDEDFSKICPGHYKRDCKILNTYLFYLVLEGALCKEYITEKVFHHAYSKGAIPIIQGPSIEDCENFLPPHSYLHFDNYDTIKHLADDIIRLSKDESEILRYHKWRNHFKILNEHGYFGTQSYHLCRVCEALNYNEDKESVYSEEKIRQFLDINASCRFNYNISN